MLDEIETAARSNFIKTEIAAEAETRARQLDENPGLWIRLNPNVRLLVLANVLTRSN